MVGSAAASSRVRDMFSDVAPSTPGLVRLSAAARRAIETEVVRTDANLETGGVLLGHNLEAEILVSVAGGPGPGAVHQARRFDRDTHYASKLADEAWDRDRSQWIGEWHTHPTSSLMPSQVDLSTYRTHLREGNVGPGAFLSLLVRSRGQNCTMVGWAVTQSSLERIMILS